MLLKPQFNSSRGLPWVSVRSAATPMGMLNRYRRHKDIEGRQGFYMYQYYYPEVYIGLQGKMFQTCVVITVCEFENRADDTGFFGTSVSPICWITWNQRRDMTHATSMLAWVDLCSHKHAHYKQDGDPLTKMWLRSTISGQKHLRVPLLWVLLLPKSQHIEDFGCPSLPGNTIKEPLQFTSKQV